MTREQKHAARAEALAQLDCDRAAFIARIQTTRTCVRDITAADRAMAAKLRLTLPNLPTFPGKGW